MDSDEAGIDTRERAYRRTLRFYPARWRNEHSAALISDLMDQDDARGRRAPSRSDRLALAWHGLRQRVKLRTIGAAVAAVTGLLLTAVGAFAPLAALDVVSLHPEPFKTDPRWIPIAGGLLASVGLSGLVLTSGRGRVHLAGRAVILGLIGATGRATAPFLRKSYGPGLQGPPSTFANDDYQLLPFGWYGAAHSVFSPALSVVGITMIVASVCVLLLCFARKRLPRRKSAALDHTAHTRP